LRCSLAGAAANRENDLADPNTRQGKRTPVTLKIKFKSETLEQFIERYAVDVSQGGIFIRTKEPLAVGTQMRFEFQLRDASPLIAGEGTVVWTRENDPSRPAIAPGMGVRFDRLGDGSQTVLEKILSEKAKQAPQRGDQPTKPPMFTDTPTRVAPAPVQDALLGNDKNRKGSGGNEFETHTPLPKPMPFHSDADEFPDEAFEEATKVRALDDLIAQTAEDSGSSAAELFSGRPPGDELAARRSGGIRADSTLADPPVATQVMERGVEPSATSPGFMSGRGSQPAVLDRDSAPVLPSPPESPSKAPRLLDTSPSPRTEESGSVNSAKAALIAQNDRMEKLAKTKIGMEPAHVATRAATPTPPPQAVVARDAPTRPSGQAIADRAPAHPNAPQVQKSSKAPIIILLLLVLAGAGAAVWFFVLREKAVEDNKPIASGSDKAGPGSDKVGLGSDKVAVGSGSDQGSAAETPKGPLVDIEITAPGNPKAVVEIEGTDLKGPVPFKGKIEKDKQYKLSVSAPGFATLIQDIKGGQDKVVAKLVAKPMVITVTTEPAGALIFIDGYPIGRSTPFDVELTKAQAAKKAVRIGLRKGGFRPIDKMVDLGSFSEDPAKMTAKVDERLAVQIQVAQPPRPPVGAGSGSATPGPGSGSDTPTPGGGSATPPPGGGSATTPTPPPGGGSAKEPEPDFIKPNP
jgi:uncharacterized protein (TIGR02266 family)